MYAAGITSTAFFLTGHMGVGAVKEVNLVLKHGVEAKNYDDVSHTH